jgi:threonine/homoserine/homoserine lactone efflux protein
MKLIHLLLPWKAWETMTQEQYYQIGLDGIQAGFIFAISAILMGFILSPGDSPWWFDVGMGFAFLSSLYILYSGVRMRQKMRSVWRERGEERGEAKPVRWLYHVGDWSYFWIAPTVFASSVLSRLSYQRSVLWNMSMIAVIFSCMAIMMIGIVYKSWCENYWIRKGLDRRGNPRS